MREPDDDGTSAAPPEQRDRPWVLAMWRGGSADHNLPREGSIVIGRAPECDLVVRHRSVSRQHARLYAGSPMRLEDLSSVNGTTVAGKRIAPHELVPIREGQALLVGEVTLLLQGMPASVAEQGPALVAEDPEMRRAVALADVLAPTEVPVLIVGETGVGATTLAERVHRGSLRAGAAFVRTSASALAHADAEHELVGDAAHRGLLQRAEGGTLLVEGVSELGALLQARLLRAVDAHEVLPFGATEPCAIDVRIIATSTADLAARVDRGMFRSELYYRLSGATIVVPPLRARPSDVLPLASAFLDHAERRAGKGPKQIEGEARALLEGYAWPGNVRQLRNVVETAALVGGGASLDAAEVLALLTPALEYAAGPGHAGGHPKAERPPTSGDGGPRPGARALAKQMADVERTRIVEALERCGGNQTRAAELLGISRRTLVARLTEYELPRPLKGRGR
jgi:two-component system, NtrC family, response regulator AtoC